MKIQILNAGPLGTNCYICSHKNKAIVIDPNYSIEPIVSLLEGLTLEAIILTHGHIDHISALNELKALYPNIIVYTHELEKIYLIDPTYNLSSILLESPYIYSGEVTTLEDEQVIQFLGEEIKVFHTPGHSLGSLSFYFVDQKLVFSGDVLFKGSIGRSDFKGGNENHLIQSIKQKLYKLPGSTIVYSGHGEKTTIAYEVEHNCFTK